MKRKDMREGCLIGKRTGYLNVDPLAAVGRVLDFDVQENTVTIEWLWPQREIKTRQLEPLFRQSTRWQYIADPVFSEYMELAVECATLARRLLDLEERMVVLARRRRRRRFRRWRP